MFLCILLLRMLIISGTELRPKLQTWLMINRGNECTNTLGTVGGAAFWLSFSEPTTHMNSIGDPKYCIYFLQFASSSLHKLWRAMYFLASRSHGDSKFNKSRRQHCSYMGESKHICLWKTLTEMGVLDHLTCLWEACMWESRKQDVWNPVWNSWLVQDWESTTRHLLSSCLFNLSRKAHHVKYRAEWVTSWNQDDL